MRLGFALFLALAWPVLAWGQSIPVRSGEHGSFTRLVFDVPVGMNWTLDPVARDRIRLTLDPGPQSFDLTGVFERIDRSRVAALEVAEGSAALDILLGCACAPQAFMQGARMLVVDLRPGELILAASGEAADKSSPVRAASAPLVADLSSVRIDNDPGIGPAPSHDPLMPNLTTPMPIKRQGGTVDPDGIEAQIARDIAFAAAQGLLTPSVTPALPDTRAEPAAKQLPLDPASGPDIAERLLAGLSDVSHDENGRGHISVGGTFCAPEKTANVNLWVDEDAPIGEALAAARSAVFGEFDRIDRDALIANARTLLYFGFGAEARMTLNLDPEGTDPMLAAMSYLVDTEEDPSRWFAGQTECVGPAALWAVLDLQPQTSSPVINRDAVLQTFERIPRHLSQYLGPTLAENLANAGDRVTAKEILRRLQRMEGEETDSIALGKAKIALQDGHVDGVGETLEHLARSPGPEASRAVAAAVDLAEATDAPVSDDIVELSAAFAHEYRDTDEGPGMWRAHIGSLVANSAFSEAFAAIEDDKGIPPELAKSTYEHALEKLTRDGDDVTFLKVALSEPLKMREGRDLTLVLDMTARMLDLGLPEPVLDMLQHHAVPSKDKRVRVAKATALLQLSRPEEAELLLISQQGEDVARLRAEARTQMGDHEYARTVFDDVGADKDALNAAWLSGNWENVAGREDSTLTPMARLILEEQVVVDPEALSLSDAEQLSASSAAARETLRSLLDATRIVE